MGGPADHSDQSRGGEQHTDTKNTLVYIHTTDRVIDYCIVQMCPVGVEILHLHCVCYNTCIMANVVTGRGLQ